LYAIGEIALVVVGILIALQINNWNQNRMDKAEEKRILSSISAEIGNLSWQSLRGLNTYQDIVKSSDKLLLSINDPNISISEDSLDYHLGVITNRWMFGKGNNANIYDALAASGELKFIQSDKLRNTLTFLDRQMQLLSVYEEYQTKFVDDQLFPFLNQQIDGIKINDERAKYLIDRFSLDQVSAKISLKKGRNKTNASDILNSQEFSNLLVVHIKNSATLIPIYQRISAYIDQADSIKQVEIQK
jgi:hypothetical protein